MIQVLHGKTEPCSFSMEHYCVSFWLDSYDILLSSFSGFIALGRGSRASFDRFGWALPPDFCCSPLDVTCGPSQANMYLLLLNKSVHFCFSLSFMFCFTLFIFISEGSPVPLEE